MFLFIGRLFTTEHAPNTHHFINTVSAPHNLRTFHGAVSRDIKLLKAHLPHGIFVKCFEDRMVVTLFFHSFFQLSSSKRFCSKAITLKIHLGCFLYLIHSAPFLKMKEKKKKSELYLEPSWTSTMELFCEDKKLI